MADSKGSDVRFELQYQSRSGQVNTIGKWREVYDGQTTRIDLDLSDLAGKSVQFILKVEEWKGQIEKANAFWLAPQVVVVSAEQPDS